MNRLKDATSPYLLQHAGNPVDWWEWGEDALAEARRRDVPILLSVGYAACHWCHVMAHESFEDGPTAGLMNELFVNIKVDREERPDIDAVYMEATQAMTGQGGWPMTVFMTPDGAPFYCGTYFPREHFQAVLRAVDKAWREQRDDIEQQGRHVVEVLTSKEGKAGLAGGLAPDGDALIVAAQELAEDYDAARGGFGGAPKFPPSMVLEFLLRHHVRTRDDQALAMAGHSLEAMARGGMYDQLGGGFARYSVDASWVVPHFEKMLYDNALLARVYAHWWRITGSVFARRIALETCDWMVHDLRTAEGGFASALDADSEGEEGRYYVWTPEQLEEVLGAEGAALAVELFDVTGTFEHDSSVLQLHDDPDDRARYERIRAALLAARERRVPPARDDEVVASWNGLAVAALAECGALFGRPDLVRAAEETAGLLVDVHLRDGRLTRTSRDGVAGANAGVLDDYGNVAEGLLALHGVTGDPKHLRLAGELLETVLEHFSDGADGFYDTADDAERLFQRPKDPTDNASPSGQFAAAGALLSFAALTASSWAREAAWGALAPAKVLVERGAARFAGWGLAVAEANLAGPLEIGILGEADDPRTHELHRTALMATSPGAVVSIGVPGTRDVPLLDGRPLVDGVPTAYVCKGFECRLPVTTTAALGRELQE
ncbi:thioredoxin domain-containing protein [Actinomadura harenae]|uniref:Thioredoxin domain-containing protein n=1 Tax=Actinomadura harenae TaxID=2483351 RepID=A0A3M2M4W5_9ACTN|nr:thioredoxin domain-containing protein [Actinomadura harenae]RMI44512.1 thioredoxin domain-containing protein [Actinomadura harenae]